LSGKLFNKLTVRAIKHLGRGKWHTTTTGNLWWSKADTGVWFTRLCPLRL